MVGSPRSLMENDDENAKGRRARHHRPVAAVGGTKETRPRGYLPAKDDPERDRDAVGENLKDPHRGKVSDAGKTKG